MFLLRREPNEAVPSSLSGNKAFRVEHGFHGAVESFPAALLQFITVFIRQCLLSETRVVELPCKIAPNIDPLPH